MLISSYGVDCGDAVHHNHDNTCSTKIIDFCSLECADAPGVYKLEKLVERARSGLRVDQVRLAGKSISPSVQALVAMACAELRPRTLLVCISEPESISRGVFAETISRVQPDTVTIMVQDAWCSYTAFLKLVERAWPSLKCLTVRGMLSLCDDNIAAMRSVISAIARVVLEVGMPLTQKVAAWPSLPLGAEIHRATFVGGRVTGLNVYVFTPRLIELLSALGGVKSLRELEISVVDHRECKRKKAQILGIERGIEEFMTASTHLRTVQFRGLCMCLLEPVFRGARHNHGLRKLSLRVMWEGPACGSGTWRECAEFIEANTELIMLEVARPRAYGDWDALVGAFAHNTKLRVMSSDCASARPDELAERIYRVNSTLESFMGIPLTVNTALNSVRVASLERWLPRDLIGAVAEFVERGAAKVLHCAGQKRVRELPVPENEPAPKRRRTGQT